MSEKHTSSGPPLCVQLFSALALVCFGIYCIGKGVSFGLFNWWYILGAACLLATAFAAFRVYEVCVILARRETEGDACVTLPKEKNLHVNDICSSWQIYRMVVVRLKRFTGIKETQ
ncbi:hypothetical protein PO909_026604 [Leuciscus waleckii]